MCKFSGLSAFPFDTLRCQLEFGGWLMSGGHQGIRLDGVGFSFSPQEATSGSSYQEYTIANVTAVLVNNVYPCCPNEPWPAVLYTVSLHRATSFYVLVIIAPTIIITLLSFAVFFLPTNAGDALGFGITIIVVVILMQVRLLAFPGSGCLHPQQGPPTSPQLHSLLLAHRPTIRLLRAPGCDDRHAAGLRRDPLGQLLRLAQYGLLHALTRPVVRQHHFRVTCHAPQRPALGPH